MADYEKCGKPIENLVPPMIASSHNPIRDEIGDLKHRIFRLEIKLQMLEKILTSTIHYYEQRLSKL